MYPPVCADGSFLAIGAHHNCIYIYGVSDSGRKYTRVGKCSVSVSPFLVDLCPVICGGTVWAGAWQVHETPRVSLPGSFQLHHSPGLVCKLTVPCVEFRRL